MARLKSVAVMVANDNNGKPYLIIEGIGKGQNPEAMSLEFRVFADEITVEDVRK